MPRVSAEARSGDLYRVGGRPPPVPGDLSPAAAAIWRECTNARAADWFDGASLGLLRQFCRTMARAERVALALEVMAADDREAEALERRLIGLNGSCTTLATKLRISVQNRIDRKSGALSEKGDEEADQHSLLGGHAIGLRPVQ